MRVRTGISIVAAIAMTTIAPTPATALPNGPRLPMAVCGASTPPTALGFNDCLGRVAGANPAPVAAAAVISPIVSFFTRRPMVSAAIITGDNSPPMIWRISSSISS